MIGEEALLGWIVPKVIEYCLKNIGKWAEPLGQQLACKALDFGSEHYLEKKAEIAKLVRGFIPGERFDDIGVELVDRIVTHVMSEIAHWLNCAVAAAGREVASLSPDEVADLAREAAANPSIVGDIAGRLIADAKEFLAGGVA